MPKTEPLKVNENKLTLTTEEARQGETEHYVRYVLAISLTLVLVGFAIVYAIYS